MRVFNDFRCKTCDEYYTDCYVDNKRTTIECQNCGALATKVQFSPNFVLPGNDPAGFPTAHDQWEKKRAQKKALEEKQQPTP